MAQAVSRRPPIAVVTFDPRPVHMTLVVNKMTLGQGVSPSTSVSPCRYHPPHSTTSYYKGHSNQNRKNCVVEYNTVQ